MENRPKLVELRPDRSLLNSDFDGYKLSLTQIPTVTEQLKVPVDKLAPNANQYSLLHAKLYALHNHLVGENDGTVYFVDTDLNIQKFAMEDHKFSGAVAWKIPLHRPRNSGDYKVSIKLLSDQIAVVGDGMGYLYVLDRADDHWTMMFSDEVIGPDENFVVIDVVYKDLDKPELHLLLLNIRQRNTSERYSTVLHWITLIKTDKFHQAAIRELVVEGFVQYASLERTCEALYVICDSGCSFTLDSENEVSESDKHENYTWTQTQEDVTVKFQLAQCVKDSVNVKTEDGYIQVKYDENILVEGLLCWRIDPSRTRWSVANNSLEVVLQKCEAKSWCELIKDDKHDYGDVVQPSEEELAPPAGTTFNSQQVEECDFECDKFTVFERLSRDSHEISHRVNLGSHQVLLAVNLDPMLSPGFAVRSDVDACVWQPHFESEFCLRHEGTLLALGYIQASKPQMKFFVCSPDLSYSVICEATRHIFIYCQKKRLISNELRNRITGRKVSTLAQQHVYSVSPNEEILGVYASKTYLYVLGENFIKALKI